MDMKRNVFKRLNQTYEWKELKINKSKNNYTDTCKLQIKYVLENSMVIVRQNPETNLAEIILAI